MSTYVHYNGWPCTWLLSLANRDLVWDISCVTLFEIPSVCAFCAQSLLDWQTCTPFHKLTLWAKLLQSTECCVYKGINVIPIYYTCQDITFFLCKGCKPYVLPGQLGAECNCWCCNSHTVLRLLCITRSKRKMHRKQSEMKDMKKT